LLTVIRARERHASGSKVEERIKMKSNALRLLGGTLALSAVVAALLAVFVGGAAGGEDNGAIRWDIIHISGLTQPITTLPGGMASACAASSCANMITLTGSGTFHQGESEEVTGGGTWTTSGFGAGSGTYTVTGLVSFDLAPGNLPSPPFIDGITGVAADARAGLAVLRIAYSDGEKGVLVISCDQPGTPPNLPIFEGATASKGFVDYWNRVAPESVPPFGNRTAFHVLPGGGGGD
jgi:hypothetical protein